MSDKDGGPAFPQGADFNAHGDYHHVGHHGGMTLRDYFAAAALTGMVAGGQGLQITREEFGIDSYKLADGLITVWTSKVKKARVFCKDKGIKLRELTGECEFSLPASVGDTFLTDWGAKVKRVMSEERKTAQAVVLQRAREARKTLSGVALEGVKA